MNNFKIGIAGCLGRMGKELVSSIFQNKQTTFVGGFEKKNHPQIGEQISNIFNLDSNLVVVDNSEEIFLGSDCIIDFTTPESTSDNIDCAIKTRTALVIGTTGLNEKILKEIEEASKIIPILQSTNMSLGVNTLFNLVELSASIFDTLSYDIEISETHNKHKVDAPSGTAITLGEYAAKGRKVDFNSVKNFDRTNKLNPRTEGEIGFSVTRGGEITGEHTVSYIGKNDRIDLQHKAFNRSIFVEGAVRASIFLSQSQPGKFTMQDVINFHIRKLNFILIKKFITKIYE